MCFLQCGPGITKSFHSYSSLIVGMVLMPGESLYACNLSYDLVLALQLSLYTTRFIFRKLGKCVLNGNYSYISEQQSFQD